MSIFGDSPYKKVKTCGLVEEKNCLITASFQQTLKIQIHQLKSLIQQKNIEIGRNLQVKEELDQMLGNKTQHYLTSNPLSALSTHISNNIHPFDEFIQVKPCLQTFKKENLLKKSPQSKFKNIYGLLLGRVIRTCKNYSKLSPEQIKNIGHNSRYHYIHEKINLLENKKDFEKYINKYCSESKTTTRNRGKSKMENFLKKDVKWGLVLVELIQEFLCKHNHDFKEYISEGERSKKISKVLEDEGNLRQLHVTFKKIKDELHDMLKDHDYLSKIKLETKEEPN